MKLLKPLLFISILAILIQPKGILADCQRSAKLGNKIIYLDTPDGKKGEGLREIFKNNKTSLDLLSTYQENLKLNNISKFTGSIGTIGLIGGFAYQGDERTRDNLIMLSAVTLGVNYLLMTTFKYYNEENLQKAIKNFNETNENQILFNVRHIQNENVEVYVANNWSF
ncbi:MAG: hypothetical protein CME61_02345 [Halobacteriovoraceae bacterium]|nr:hypothetical protein [Halobacteriovoraceae bacterium]|tara:strand:- start:242 stop:745 length:504 start_codon:yes stop_codon:yes gene_type:complete